MRWDLQAGRALWGKEPPFLRHDQTQIPKRSHFSRLISVTAHNTECKNYSLRSENLAMVKVRFLRWMTFSALLDQTNPDAHLWTHGKVSMCRLPLWQAGRLLFLLLCSISPSLPLGCRLPFVVPDTCILHPKAFWGSVSSVLPGKRDTASFLADIRAKRKPSSLQFDSFLVKRTTQHI